MGEHRRAMDTVGIVYKTAVKWADLAARDWSSYITARAGH